MNYIEELKNIEKVNNIKIIYCSYVGSKLYGTQNEKSDTDLRFVYTNTVQDLILQKSRTDISIGTKTTDKNTNQDVDFDGWSLQRFMDLIKAGDTNAIDLLFSMSNENMIIYENKEFTKLLKENYHKLVNNNIRGFVGYCLSQTKKFGIKGARYDELDKFYNEIKKYNSNNKLSELFPLMKDIVKDYNYIKFVMAPSSRDNNNIIEYISVLGKLFSSTISIEYFIDRLKQQYEQFGARTITTAQTKSKKDPKSSYHALRVALELQELLTHGKINFPLKDRLKLTKIKEDNFDFDEMVNEIELILEDTDRLLLESRLVEESDIDLIEQIILKFIEN